MEKIAARVIQLLFHPLLIPVILIQNKSLHCLHIDPGEGNDIIVGILCHLPGSILLYYRITFNHQTRL